MSQAILIDNLSKLYNLGQVGTGTLSKDINRLWCKLRGKPDPYATLAEINDRTVSSNSGSVWALKDINLTVNKGEVIGVVGRNGAGKSTLLKIISGITSPTKGRIFFNGRLASLLEVGTGMHPEMTARENIFLNGAIMGMTRSEINKKLDDIIDFAGIVKYVDTPIKRFSSGMKVRLGFAVAAFLEPEILIVDEVLAVGDDEFQKRAVGKMKEVSKGGGRTVLFVSHNMVSVGELCQKVVLLDKGKIEFEGGVKEGINKYLFQGNELETTNSFIPKKGTKIGDSTLLLKSLRILDHNFNSKFEYSTEEDIYVEFGFQVFEPQINFRFILYVKDRFGQHVFTSMSTDLKEFRGYKLKEGEYTYRCKIPKLILRDGSYIVSVDGGIFGVKTIFKKAPTIYFKVFRSNLIGDVSTENRNGVICPVLEWELNSI